LIEIVSQPTLVSVLGYQIRIYNIRSIEIFNLLEGRMKIGIIGAGKMGSALGKIWVQQGHQVLLSYSRDLAQLHQLADSIGAKSATPTDAANFGDVIMLAVPYPALHEILTTVLLENKIVITCVSGLKPDFEGNTVGLPSELQTSVAEEIARSVPGAKVVEAFNTTFAEILQSDSRDFNGQRPSVLFCGEDRAAKEVVATLIKDCGYDAIDVGTLQVARTLETFATVWVQMAAVSQTFPNVAIKVLQR
jgi:8-hydroxy-5-deazaflavin:NADPH oxidoreductase